MTQRMTTIEAKSMKDKWNLIAEIDKIRKVASVEFRGNELLITFDMPFYLEPHPEDEAELEKLWNTVKDRGCDLSTMGIRITPEVQ
jgi:hypothetical protein